MAKLDLTLAGEHEAVLRRSFQAPRALVWRCHTEAPLVRRWLTGPPGWTMPICEIDLRVGGRFRYVWRDRDGRDMGMGGTFRAIEPPARLVTTELFDEDWTGGETLVTQVFAEAGGTTTLTMTIRYSSAAARTAALKTGMTDGMEMSYAHLDALLSGPAI